MNAMLQAGYEGKVHRRPRASPRWYFERDVETMPRETLAELQLERLRATVRDAYSKVPLHRGRMHAIGLSPRDIRSLDDVRLLPFTVKSDLRDHYPFGMFARRNPGSA